MEGNYNEYFSEIRSRGFGKEAKRRVIIGTFSRMAGYKDAYYLRALKVRSMIIGEFKKVFSKYDAIISPTMPFVAPKLREAKKSKPLEEYKADVLTVPPNLSGLPHISIPCGLSESMPVGLHIITDHFSEGKLLGFAQKCEKKMKFRGI